MSGPSTIQKSLGEIVFKFREKNAAAVTTNNPESERFLVSNRLTNRAADSKKQPFQNKTPEMHTPQTHSHVSPMENTYFLH